MRRFTIRLLATVLAFVVGVSAQTVWVKKDYLIDLCSRFLQDWQD